MAEERRLVTVLFADVTGSTVLGESLDPEDVRALLARFYTLAKEVVITHGGTLEKFIGDAVMAVFGLPQAHGDDPQRALSAALELRDRVRADSTLSSRLSIHVGLNTGEVVATRDTTAGDFLLTGDPVNIAARLQQVADPWAVLCSERTARAARDAFRFGPPIDVVVKGKGQPLRAVAVLERAAAPVTPARIPLIGRDADLAHIKLVAQRVFTERRPFLVSLVAPAGTGKTRLLEEFLDHLSALTPKAVVAIAQCLPYGQRLTYWPLRAVLFRLAEVAEDATPGAVRDGLERWLRDTNVGNPARVADFLAATVGLGETEVADRDGLFAAWRTAVEAAARQRPLVLVFEDLHWSSDSLLDLVEFIMQPRGEVPVLMVALTRPELLERRPAWGGGRRNYVSLALDPLEDGAVAELVEHLLGRPSPEIVARVVARAEGNPFYAGEIVRSIIDRVPSLDDRAAVERTLITLPDTVQATVLARLDLLPADERRILQLGSVFGRSFRVAEITALAPDMAAEGDRLADRLIAKDLLHPSDGDRLAFRHILIREVAYQTLPRSGRAQMHAAAGRWLEGQAVGREDSLAELIAYHFREAALLGSAVGQTEGDAAETRRKAVSWLVRAADVAMGGSATVEAARHLRGAIELAERDVLPELYERLGIALTGGNAAVEAFRLALRLCRESGRSADQELRVLASLLTVYMRWQASVQTRPSLEEIERLRKDGRVLIERARDERATASFLVANAFYPFWQQGDVTSSELQEAEAGAKRGLDIAQRLGDANLQSAALDALSGVAQARGSWEDVRAFARQRLLMADRPDLAERMDAHQMVAWASALLGDLTEVERVSAVGLASLQLGQAPQWALGLITWRVYGLTLAGRWDQALASAERAVQLWLEVGRIAAGYTLRGFIAALDIACARRDSQLMGRYREILEEILLQFGPDTPFGLMLPYTRADLEGLESQIIRNFRLFLLRIELVERALALSTDRGHPASAVLVEPIVEHATQHGLRILEGQARRAIGVARNEQAELTRALNIFEDTVAVPYAARVRCERALLTRDETELTAGMRALEALGDLDQLDRVEQSRRRC